jgi:phage terminase large subunit-like protein
MPSFKKTDAQVEATHLLSSQAKHILLYGGSRSGKTFIFLRSIVIRAIKEKSRHVILRHAFNHVKQSVWYDSFPKMMDICFPELPYTENRSDWFIEFPNGSQFWFGGLDDKERTEKILGNEYSTIYFNEASQISYDSFLIAKTRLAEKTGLKNKIYVDCNPPSTTHWLYKLFFEKVNPLALEEKIIDPDNHVSMRINPEHNIENLPIGYIEEILDTLPSRQRKRFREGIFMDDIEGALWDDLLIGKYRVIEAPELKRILIGVDPAVTATAQSDETGIIIAGKGIDDHGYILNDASGIFTPHKWAERVVHNYYKWNADRVIAEVNNGGDLVETNIKTIEPQISYKSVHATRGKIIRAEPVVALYEQGKVHHVGNHNKLEEQMTTWDAQNDKSPDRVDALVWVLTELMLGKKVSDNVWA